MDLRVQTFAGGPLETNAYLVVDEERAGRWSSMRRRT
jgi:hypothetical protein